MSQQGGVLFYNMLYADMAELADALDLGSSGQPCRFKSCYPQVEKEESQLFMGLDSSFYNEGLWHRFLAP